MTRLLITAAALALVGCTKWPDPRYVTATCRDPETLQAFTLDTRNTFERHSDLTQGYARVPMPSGRTMMVSDAWVASNCWNLKEHNA